MVDFLGTLGTVVKTGAPITSQAIIGRPCLLNSLVLCYNTNLTLVTLHDSDAADNPVYELYVDDSSNLGIFTADFGGPDGEGITFNTGIYLEVDAGGGLLIANFGVV